MTVPRILAGLSAAAVLSLALASGAAAQSQQAFITIGTAGVAGVYYPVGSAICQLVNQDRKRHGIRCSFESTGGSAVNLRMIRAGQMDLGVVQSDLHHQAVNGEGQFAAAGAFPELRSVFSVHPEQFTVVARVDSGIRTFRDLVGKRVNVGNPGSGQRGTMEVVMRAMGWSLDSFSHVAELPSTEQTAALCGGEVDAVVFVAGHPNGSVGEALSACDTRLVAVGGAEIERLIDATPYYGRAVIPAGLYGGGQAEVATFRVRATLVASAGTAASVVYEVVRAVFDNLDQVKDHHPAFADLAKPVMATEGMIAPLHDGARRYYEEVGLL